jgi:hypothetical protein
MRGIALGLNLPEDFFGGKRAGKEGSYWIMRVIHYPPLPEGKGARGVGGGGVVLLCVCFLSSGRSLQDVRPAIRRLAGGLFCKIVCCLVL